ncbi:MAG: glycosyltransferase [Verrucomicrobiota bacterium]|jgi:processive 1,2-diacylglycerol beta-glucosyltransferase
MRVLIATVTAGAGHLQAAAALEEAWKKLRPEDTVQKLDVLDFGTRLTKKWYAESYVKLIEHAPDLWSFLFKKTDRPDLVTRFSRLRRTMAGSMSLGFQKHLRKFRPHVIIATHYLPLELTGGLRTRRWKPFTVCTVTDFEAHALWMEPCVDLYCVAAEETKARLVARGIEADRVCVTGIPVAEKFSAKVDVRAVRRQYELKSEEPTLLVLSGGFGMGPVAEILDQIDRVPRPVQVLVVTGRNEALRDQLLQRTYRHPTQVLGFVTNMHELMAVSDLILTKPGGLTSSEALAMGKPLLILNPIPGQEAANSDFLLEHGAASKANRMEDLPFRLEQLLGSGKLRVLSRAAREIGKPRAAETICNEICRRTAERIAARSQTAP